MFQNVGVNDVPNVRLPKERPFDLLVHVASTAHEGLLSFLSSVRHVFNKQ